MTGGRDDLAAMATYEKLVSSPLVLQAAVQLLYQPTRALFQEPDPELLAADFAEMLKVRGVRHTNIL